MLIPSKNTDKLMAYCDSDWGGCIESRMSIVGYMVMFGKVVVSWNSKKQDTVARSSAEAKFKSMAEV